MVGELIMLCSEPSPTNFWVPHVRCWVPSVPIHFGGLFWIICCCLLCGIREKDEIIPHRQQSKQGMTVRKSTLLVARILALVLAAWKLSHCVSKCQPVKWRILEGEEAKHFLCPLKLFIPCCISISQSVVFHLQTWGMCVYYSVLQWLWC